MQQFWNIISKKHKEKLSALADSKGVDHETAMRNIINYMVNDSTPKKMPEYFKGMITARHIESFIDLITI